MSQQPIKTCVLGVGLSGLTFHIPFILALSDLFTLHSVLERNPTSAGGKVKERFPEANPKVYTTLEEVLADGEIELVIVGTPNETHYTFAKRILEAGKHVLVDKPVTTNSADAKELGALAKSKGLVLYAYQNRRWDADFLALLALRSLPESDPRSIGQIHEFESHFDRYRKGVKGTWKDEPSPGNGNTFDLGSHLIDQTLQLFGRPQKLTAFIENARGVGHADLDDTFTIIMQYPRPSPLAHPIKAILRATLSSVRSKQVRYIVRGTKGTYLKYGVDPQEDRLKGITSPTELLAPGFGKDLQELEGTIEVFNADDSVRVETWPSEAPGQMVGLFRNLAAGIREKGELDVKWEEATMVIEMVELAFKSSKEGRTVEVPA